MLNIISGMVSSMSLLGQSIDATNSVVGAGSMALLLAHLLAATVFAVLGIVVLFLAILLMDKVTPFSIVKEVIEEHNQALATIVAAVVVGIAVIIASAILG
jgi:putative membrane protein